MNIQFKRFTEPTPEIAQHLERWENDPSLVPFARPNKDQLAIETKSTVSVESLNERLAHEQLYLIYVDDQLVGEMDYQVDPPHLYKKGTATAWIGIIIGEQGARGKGIGVQAMHYLEDQIKQQGLKRIELGVFEFNTNAIKLYQKLGYQEIARLPDFTFWQGKMWQDIRMEKYI